MKEMPDFKPLLSKEQEEREGQRGVLESLSGFKKLSEDQRRYLLAMLYVQQRAERETDPVSASRIHKMPEQFKGAPGRAYIAPRKTPSDDPDEQQFAKRYHASQLHIMNEYCHRVIDTLESYGTGEQWSKKEWHDAGPISSYAELEDLVNMSEEQDGYPLVIEVLTERGESVHTTLLLGRNVENELVVWEKAGYHMPFQIVTLASVYNAYKYYTGWRMRELSV